MSTHTERSQGEQSMSAETDTADLSREELSQRVAELEQEVTRLDNLVIRLFDKIKDELEPEIDANSEDIAEVEALAQNAIGIAQAEVKTDVSADTQKGACLRVIRRKLIKDAHRSQNSKSAVTTSVAKTQAEAELDREPESRTVHDAMKTLAESWDAIEYVTGDPGPQGKENRVKCDGDRVEPSLIRSVANALTNDGLRESLIMKADDGGGV